MRMLLASVLAAALQTSVSAVAHASPVSFAVDLSFPFAPAPGHTSAPIGTFRNAGSFGVESSLLPSRGNALISFGQIHDFHLQLPELEVGPELLENGRCWLSPGAAVAARTLQDRESDFRVRSISVIDSRILMLFDWPDVPCVRDAMQDFYRTRGSGNVSGNTFLEELAEAAGTRFR